MPNKGHFDQYRFEGFVCNLNQCRWMETFHCREHGEIGKIILAAFSDSEELINEEVAPTKELITRNNLRVKDAAKWLSELVHC